MGSDLVFDFPLDQGDIQSEQILVYRPWGTRTLKVKVSNGQGQGELRLRPAGVNLDEFKLGIFGAYDDESETFRLSWGGGHEVGPCVQSKDALGAFEKCAELEEDETNVSFFNVRHIGPDLPDEASITLEAAVFDEKTGERAGDPAATLKIKVVKPSGIDAFEEVMRFEPGSDGDWALTDGRYLPSYESRWWPETDVPYEENEAPPLTIHLEDEGLSVQWEDEEIATIEDYSDPPVLLGAEPLAVELFAFDEWSYALRVWFFWLDKHIGGDFFVGRHEVPDAERFDMIIRRSDGRVLMACTDLHWRESWARVMSKKKLRATVGMPREVVVQLAKDEMTKSWKDIWEKAAGIFKKKDVEPEPSNNPVDPYVRRLAKRYATTTVKAAGTESHIPMLHNVEQRKSPRMTSSDVRLG